MRNCICFLRRRTLKWEMIELTDLAEIPLRGYGDAEHVGNLCR